MEERIDVKYLPLWSRYLEMFDDAGLTDAQLGRLIRMMMEYQFRGQEPETVPKALRTAWAFVRKDLDDARIHYEVSVRNGRKGGRKKSPKEPEITQESLMQGTTTSTSTSTSTTSSTTTSSSIDTGSAPASPAEDAGICSRKKSYGEFGWVKLTGRQYRDLEMSMGESELKRCIAYVDEAAQSNGNRNRWKDWYLVVRRCHEHRWYETKARGQEIPKGASGVLGQAELEAIQRVLREDSLPGEQYRM